MNNLFDNAPHRFDPAEPPAELDSVVRAAIEEGNRRYARRRVPLRRTLAVGLAAALCLGFTALAAGGTLGRIFSGFFGPEHAEVADSIASPASQRVSSAGVTITADAAITDGSVAAVALTARRDDGLPFDAAAVWDTGSCRLDYPGAQNWSERHTLSLLEDGSLRIYAAFQTDAASPSADFSLSLSGLGVEGNAALSETRYDGEWNFDFTGVAPAETRAATSHAPIEASCGSITDADFSLSPVGVRYTLSGSFQAELDSEELPRVSLLLKDGREIDLTFGGGASSSDMLTRSLVFEEIVPLEQMDAVLLEGERLAIE